MDTKHIENLSEIAGVNIDVTSWSTGRVDVKVWNADGRSVAETNYTPDRAPPTDGRNFDDLLWAALGRYLS